MGAGSWPVSICVQRLEEQTTRVQSKSAKPSSGICSLLQAKKGHLLSWSNYLEDMVRLFGALLLLDPIRFPKSEPCLIIGSVCQIGALLGTSLYV